MAFLIAALGTASAEVEDIGPPATAFPNGDIASGPDQFRDGDGFGTSRGEFTSLSVGGKLMSSLGSDIGAPPDDQDDGGPDYELHADYSSSRLDGGLFPATVTGFESVDSLILSDPILFGDSDHVGGFSVNASRSWSFVLSNFDPSEDRTRKRGSTHCSSNGSLSGVVRCETEEDLGSFMTASPGQGSNGADQSGPQSSSLPGLNAPFGGGYLSARQILGLEMMAAQNSFAMTWPSGVIQGAFPPCGACDVTPSVVDAAVASTSDFGNTGGSLNSDQTLDLSGGGSLANIVTAQQTTSVPEIPPPAMLLIGFVGLALIGRRRLWGSAHLG